MVIDKDDLEKQAVDYLRREIEKHGPCMTHAMDEIRDILKRHGLSAIIALAPDCGALAVSQRMMNDESKMISPSKVCRALMTALSDLVPGARQPDPGAHPNPSYTAAKDPDKSLN